MRSNDQTQVANLIRVKCALNCVGNLVFGVGGTEQDIMDVIALLESFKVSLEHEIFGSNPNDARGF